MFSRYFNFRKSTIQWKINITIGFQSFQTFRIIALLCYLFFYCIPSTFFPYITDIICWFSCELWENFLKPGLILLISIATRNKSFSVDIQKVKHSLILHLTTIDIVLLLSRSDNNKFGGCLYFIFVENFLFRLSDNAKEYFLLKGRCYDNAKNILFNINWANLKINWETNSFSNSILMSGNLSIKGLGSLLSIDLHQRKHSKLYRVMEHLFYLWTTKLWEHWENH